MIKVLPMSPYKCYLCPPAKQHRVPDPVLITTPVHPRSPLSGFEHPAHGDCPVIYCRVAPTRARRRHIHILGDTILFKSIVLPVALAGAAFVAGTASADEGQWQPYQLKQLKSELKRIGITIPADKLADLSKHPMSAIVSTGRLLGIVRVPGRRPGGDEPPLRLCVRSSATPRLNTTTSSTATWPRTRAERAAGRPEHAERLRDRQGGKRHRARVLKGRERRP